MKIYLLLLFSIFIPSLICQQYKSISLVDDDIVLLNEVFHFNAELGKKLWDDWESFDYPFLYKRGDYDFLINHPSPTEEFKKYYDQKLNKEIYYRVTTDSNFYLAAYPAIDFKWTVVISKPDSSYNPYKWILKANHELFHIYQNRKNIKRVINPFVNEYSNEHEISFPFIYDDELLNASLRIEAEILFNLIRQDSIIISEVNVARKVFDRLSLIQKDILKDSLHYTYKKWMEWNEGIAKYTEYKLAEIASQTYRATEEFNELYPDYNYKDLWEDEYRNSTNPIRFVGEEVTGRIIFYYLGLAKGLLLDKISPQWRDDFWENNLDSIIENN